MTALLFGLTLSFLHSSYATDHSLFQRGLIRQQTRTPEDDESGSVSPDAVSLQSALLTVKAIASNVTEWNTNLTEAEKSALDVIQTFIQRMFTTAASAHAEDRREVTRVSDLLEVCSNKTTSDLSVVSSLKGSMETARADHDACRTREASLVNESDKSCAAWEEKRKGLVPASCAGILFDTATLGTDDAGARASMEQCLRDLQSFYLAHMSCRQETSSSNQTTQFCNDNQTSFELSFCQYSSKLATACSAQTSCRTDALAWKTATEEDVRKSEMARKSDYITGKHILCLFRVFEADNADKNSTLQECDALSVDTSSLDIVYPDVPVETTCTPEPYEPCDPNWTSSEYESRNWYSKVDMATCGACMKPTSAPSPAPTEACVGPGAPPGATRPRISTASSMAGSHYYQHFLDSTGCIRTMSFLNMAHATSWGPCLEGWPTTGIKSLESGNYMSLYGKHFLLMDSGEVYCNDARICHDLNADGVGTLPYPDMQLDPAVQVNIGINVAIVTQSGKVYELEEWPGVGPTGFGDTMQQVIGLPPDVVQVTHVQWGPNVAVTQSGEMWMWGRYWKNLADLVDTDADASVTPVKISWSPPDGSRWLDALIGGSPTLYARTTTGRLYARGPGGSKGCSQEMGGPAPGPHELVLPQLNGAEDPIKNYWAGYAVVFILGESNKLYSVGGTDMTGDGKCGANGLPETPPESLHTACFASPNPRQLMGLAGKVPVQLSRSSTSYKPQFALMDTGEIYMWGTLSSELKCAAYDVAMQSFGESGAAQFFGGPTPMLVGTETATVPLPACP